MKLIRTYVLLAILNWIVVSAAVISVPALRNRRAEAILPAGQTPVAPTPTPKRRVVHVKRVIVVSPTGAPEQVASGGQAVIQTEVPQAAATVPNPAPTADQRCIIVIDGVSYDVTQFRSLHSGGDIFTCSTDMSATFWSRHGAGTLKAMARYRL